MYNYSKEKININDWLIEFGQYVVGYYGKIIIAFIPAPTIHHHAHTYDINIVAVGPYHTRSRHHPKKTSPLHSSQATPTSTWMPHQAMASYQLQSKTI